MSSTPLVLIVMGSESDIAVMSEAKTVLNELDIPCEMTIASAHRTPARAIGLAEQARRKGFRVIIAGAGGAAHLAGVMAAHTVLPVIGVPIDSSPLKGIDSLLSTVQMPAGVPVATMAIGKAGARNAAFMAAQILGLSDAEIQERVISWRAGQLRGIEEKATALEMDRADG